MAAFRLDQPLSVELGLDFPFQRLERVRLVTRIEPNSPAESAGIRVGDKVLALDGLLMESDVVQRRVYLSHKPGDWVRLTIRRPGVAAPFDLVGVFRSSTDAADTLLENYTREFRNFYPLVFVLVGFVPLFLRPDDLNLWLLALFFAGLIASPAFPNDFNTVPAFLRPGVIAYRGLVLGLFGGSFYFLCAAFPIRSPIDKSAPWLKWAAIGMGVVFAGETNGPDFARPFPVFSSQLGMKTADTLWFETTIFFLALALVSLASS